jgi:PAS domain S-box-containing protein
VFRDIGERRRAEEALRETTQTLRAVVEASPLGIYVFDVAGNVRLWNPAAERIFGWTAAEVIGRALPTIPEEGQERFRELQGRVLRGEDLAGLEVRRRRKDGSPIDVSLSTAGLRDREGTIVAVMTVIADVTERRQWEQQLRQSQKMEAIGRLAGGVAHDFNNLLTVITGRSNLALERLAPDHRARGDVDLIARTADRASRLTRQLLAFSRKQILELQVLDLNAVLAGMESLVRPLIGESIEIEMVLDPGLGRAEVDPGQLEQIVLNLAVNARDAMPLGGRLTIETANAELDAGYARQHAEVRPGHYVMLAVSDTGTGMDGETRARVFEPFFTTKGVGEGTGLGLATIYGIVKQSGGHIAVYSEVGHGTSFKIYLPRVETPAGELAVAPAPSVRQARSETVLLVEDAKDLRALAREILEEEGYTVLAAGDPSEALEVTSRHPGPIHLLLTDVVMPGMGGRELASRLTRVRPNMRVLYMSGYTDDSVVRHGVLEREVSFLQKPFTVRGLSQKVREVLEPEGAAV